MATDPAAGQDGVLGRLRDLQLAERLSNRAMAGILGCSPATWSQICSGTYRGDVGRYLDAGVRWEEDRANRVAAAKAGYVDTSISRKILAVCHRAWSMPTIGRVITPSGCGKTVALREFLRRWPDRTLLLQAGEFLKTPQALLGAICRGLGLGDPFTTTIAETEWRVREKLRKRFNGGVGVPFTILVDEAHSVNAAGLNFLRNLHDDPEAGVALVLADTSRFNIFLYSARGIAGGNEQLRARFGAVCEVGEDAKIPAADVRAVADSLVAGLGHRAPLSPESLKFLVKVAQGGGHFRDVSKRLHAVRDVAAAEDAELEYTHAQLDFVATLVGEACEMEHPQPPFARAARGVAATRAG